MNKSNIGLIVGLVVCLAFPALLVAGNSAIDQPEPDRDLGLIFYGVVGFLCFAAIGIIWALPGAPDPVHLAWLLLGAAVGAFLANVMEGYPYTFSSMAIWMGFGAGIGVLASWLTSERGDQTARVIASSVAFALFVAAVYHATTIDRQVEMAAAAHRETPGVGLVFVAVALFGLAVNRKRL